jgi:ornithine cyclodeaminase/alanine dehydrogenase-like protein (mu-crystallin family)
VSEFLLLTQEHVRSVLPIRDLIPCMEAALGRFSAGEVQQPVRTVLQVGVERHWWGLMPAYVDRPATMGAKLVTVFNTNAARGLDTHQAFIVLLDPDTGALQALMDGRYVTEARTAAVSAVSARYLARVDASTRFVTCACGAPGRRAASGSSPPSSRAPVCRFAPSTPPRTRFAAPISSCSPLRHRPRSWT